MKELEESRRTEKTAGCAEELPRVSKTLTIAIEGIDGSGKSVQFARLKSRLEDAGYRGGGLDFPCYEFLSGSGEVSAKDIDVRSMSLWYAMDRAKAYERFNEAEFDVVLLNRSTMANAAYQGSRVQIKAKENGDDPQKALEEYISWLFKLEFEILGITKPDLFLIFDVPVNVSRKNVAKKGRRDYVGGEKADVYEKDTLLLDTVRRGYHTCAQMFEGVHIIDCTDGKGAMQPIEQISDTIMDIVSPVIEALK